MFDANHCGKGSARKSRIMYANEKWSPIWIRDGEKHKIHALEQLYAFFRRRRRRRCCSSCWCCCCEFVVSFFGGLPHLLIPGKYDWIENHNFCCWPYPVSYCMREHVAHSIDIGGGVCLILAIGQPNLLSLVALTWTRPHCEPQVLGCCVRVFVCVRTACGQRPAIVTIDKNEQVQNTHQHARKPYLGHMGNAVPVMCASDRHQAFFFSLHNSGNEQHDQWSPQSRFHAESNLHTRVNHSLSGSCVFFFFFSFAAFFHWCSTLLPICIKRIQINEKIKSKRIRFVCRTAHRKFGGSLPQGV